MLTFSPADFETMHALEVELAHVLRRANDQHVEAALAVFALLRCARPLLDKYPPAARQQLMAIVVAFLEHVEVEGGFL